MRKFKVEVTRTDEYVVEIDEDKLDKDLITKYEATIGKLNEKDKIKDLAESIGFMSMDGNEFYEGIGVINVDGYIKDEAVSGIEVSVSYTEDYDVETREKK
jgi:hypothetical protein